MPNSKFREIRGQAVHRPQCRTSPFLSHFLDASQAELMGTLHIEDSVQPIPQFLVQYSHPAGCELNTTATQNSTCLRVRREAFRGCLSSRWQAAHSDANAAQQSGPQLGTEHGYTAGVPIVGPAAGLPNVWARNLGQNSAPLRVEIRAARTARLSQLARPRRAKLPTPLSLEPRA